MNVDFKTSAAKSLKGIDPVLTNLLRKSARSAKWPENVVKSLRVAVQDLNIVIYYPEKYAEEVEDLEYGSLNSPPKPIFRTYITKNSDLISGKIEEWSVNYLVQQDLIP